MLFGWNRSIPGREKLSNEHFQDFVQYPPRQKAASFNLDAVLRQLESATDGGSH
jgi:arylsulfatase